MGNEKVPIGLQEALISPMFAADKPKPSVKKAMNGSTAPSAGGQQGGKEQQEQLPERKRADVQCPTPAVSALEVSAATVVWSQPAYLVAKGQEPDAERPRLRVESYEVDWADVPTSGVQLKDTDFRPLPNGDGQACEVQMAGLRAGHSYAVRVRPVLELTEEEKALWDLRVLPSVPIVFTTRTCPPSPVKPPLLVSRERRALKVKWNPPDEPGGRDMPLNYQLFMSPPPQEWPTPPDAQGYVELYRGPERNFRVQKLVPGTRYMFWVQAHNPVGSSEPGQVATYTTQATVPSQPLPPRPIAASQTSVTLQWSPPPDNGSPITNYVLERDEGGPLAAQQQPGGSGSPFTLCYAGPLLTATMHGLRSGMHYRVRVRADNGEGSSTWSECSLATTAASPPGPPPPPLVSNITRDSATVAWRGPDETGGAPVVLHEVELQAVSRAAIECMGPDWYKIFSGMEVACAINSLRPGCSYRVRVRSANQVGWSSWSLPVELVTAADVPEAPGCPSIAQAGTDSLLVQWHPPLHNGGAKINAYKLEMCPVEGSPFYGSAPPAAPSPGGLPGAMQVYRGEEPSVHISGLAAGGVYQFRVQAVNAQGVGPWSEWACLGTSADCPLPPGTPELAAAPSSSTLRVRWAEPEARGAPVTAYVLQLALEGFVASDGVLQPLPAPQALQQRRVQRAGSPEPPAASDVQAPAEQAGAEGPEQGSGEQQAAEAAGEGSVPPGPPQPVWQQVYKGQAAGAEIQQLLPSSRYLLRAAAINQVGISAWSPSVQLTTAPAAPAPPQQVRCEAASSSELSVSWEQPPTDHGSAVQGYLVELAPAPGSSGAAAGRGAGGAGGGKRGGGGEAAGPWQQAAKVAAGTCSCSLSGLLPGRAYQVRVRAWNACGQSQASQLASATTLPAPPSAPSKLGTAQRAATFVKLKWDAPAEENGALVEGYVVQVASASGSSEGGARSSGSGAGSAGGAAAAASSSEAGGLMWREVYAGPAETARAGDLEPATKYWFRVAAANAAGQGVFSAPEAFTTMLAPPGPPSGLQAEGVPEGAEGPAAAQVLVQLSWQAPEPQAGTALPATYELRAVPQPPGPSSGPEVKVPVGKQREAVLDRKQLPGTQYQVSVRAVGAEGAGHGAWSEAVEVVLPPLPKEEGVEAGAGSAAQGAGAGAVQGQAGAAKQRKQGRNRQAGGGAAAGAAAAEAEEVAGSAAAQSSAQVRKAPVLKGPVAQKKPPPPPGTVAYYQYLAKRFYTKEVTFTRVLLAVVVMLAVMLFRLYVLKI